MIPPWSPLYTELAPMAYDPNGARQLLQQAGWTDSNNDGLLDKGGQPLRFVLTINSSNRLHADIAQVMQRQLRQVGVDVQIQPQEFQSMLQRYKAREYDAVLANWSLDTFKVDPSPLFSCAQAQVKNSANRTGYCNPRADALLDTLPTIADRAAAKPLWSEYQRLISAEQPFTFLFFQRRLEGVHERLRNVRPDARGDWVGASRWYIRPDARQGR